MSPCSFFVTSNYFSESYERIVWELWSLDSFNKLMLIRVRVCRDDSSFAAVFLADHPDHRFEANIALRYSLFPALIRDPPYSSELSI